MKVGILALQGDVREHAAAVADLGSEPVEITAPQHVGGVDALILPGGESTTLSMLLDSSELRRPLAGLIAEGMPVLGTCAGMILLAREVIGGRPDQRGFDALDIAVRRNGFGRQLQSFECDLVVAGVSGPPVRAVFIRAPVVERVGEGVEVLARVGDGNGSTLPVLCRQGNRMASAFHPELSGDLRIHGLFLSAVG